MDTNIKIVVKNKKAYFNYEILEKYEAGVVLLGLEVKSVRDGKVSINEAYAKLRDGEVWIINMDIAPYPNATFDDYKPKRPRKLLLKRKEIKRLIGKMQEKGLTLIPLLVYFKRGIAKIEIALARGKRKYDKREKIKSREIEKDIRKYTSKGG